MVVFNLWLLPCQRCVNGIALHVFHTYEAATFILKQSDADVLWRLCSGFFLVSAAVVPFWNFHRTISVTENDRKYLKVGVKMCREYKMGIIALLFCPCGVPASESISTVCRYQHQNFNPTISFFMLHLWLLVTSAAVTLRYSATVIAQSLAAAALTCRVMMEVTASLFAAVQLAAFAFCTYTWNTAIRGSRALQKSRRVLVRLFFALEGHVTYSCVWRNTLAALLSQ